MIPKILHVTWRTRQVPPHFQRILDAWRETHSDWDIRFWTNETMGEMIATSYPGFLDLFEGYRHNIQRADAFRYFVLHKFGGVYADLDVEPLKRIDQLTGMSRLFVGLEPWDHVVGQYASYTGFPYILCNAFMGSEPGHPFWLHIFDHLVRCASDEVMISTGPFFLSGAAFSAPRDIRPDLLPPEHWSPLRSGRGSRPASLNPAMVERARARFAILEPEGGPFVSHLWAGTWHGGWGGSPYRLFRHQVGRLVWWVRRQLKPHLVRDDELFSRPAQEYDNQELSLPEVLSRIHIAVPLKNAEKYVPLVKKNIEKFDYPPELVSVGFLISDSTDGTHAAVEQLKAEWEGRFTGVEIDQLDFGYTLPRRRRHRAGMQKQRRSILGTCRTKMALRAAQIADYCLFLDADIHDVPADAIKKLLSANRPVVMANCLRDDGQTYDQNAFVLNRRPDFRYLYHCVSSDGTVYPSRRADNRYYVDDLKFLRVAPLDSVGGSLLLIENDVIRAGVVFSSEPYKYHLETEAFGIMARDRGFEVCGMPDVIIRHVDERRRRGRLLDALRDLR